MTTTIRDQIIGAIVTGLGGITTAAGYNTGIGATVYRARTAVDPGDAPFCNVFAGRETSAPDRYGRSIVTMPITIEAAAVFSGDAFYTTEEKLLGDLIERMTADVFSLSFTLGTTAIAPGNTITGAVSGATAYVSSVTVATGTWAGGNAAGTLTLLRKSGTFQAENMKVSGSVVAATAGTITGQSAVTRMTSGLSDSILYTGGGPASSTHIDAGLAGVTADFNIVYQTIAGNPYGQTA